MRKTLLIAIGGLSFALNSFAQKFTPGNLVVLQTSATLSKANSQAVLKEFTTSGSAGITVSIPTTGVTPFQTAGVFGGSEGFLSTSTDNKYLVLGGYATPNTYTDITATLATDVPRALGIVYPSGFYLQIDTSTSFYSANDIRGGISDGTNFWASGASNATDGINVYNPGAHIALASGTTPAKAYGLRIFNGQIYYATQKAGPSNTASQLGIFALGTGLPTSGTVSTTQIINTGTVIPEDFSIDPTGTICYIAVNLNTAVGGIQKWTKSGGVWSLAYTLGTGATNIGAYGLAVDYSGTYPVVYATTFDAAGNRIIKITDNGSSATATTLVAAATGVFYKGITFAPVASGTPLVNLSISTDTASEAGASVITITANVSDTVAAAKTVNIAVSGTGITSGDYTLSNTTITIPKGASSGTATFTVKDDILGEGTEVAIITMSSPSSGIALGMRTVQNITIADNDGNNIPTITFNTNTTNYIDAGVATAPSAPFKLSGVIGDPTDPAATLGVNFTIKDLETAASGLTLKVTSSNPAVVPVTGLTLTGTDTLRNLKITPAGVGFTNLILTVGDGTDSAKYTINYGASAASTLTGTIWCTGLSDASDAIAIDDTTFITGDDELDYLNVYSRQNSGMQKVSYNFSTLLNLPDPGKPEADIEAATRSFTSPNKVYWFGSMSNGKAPFDNKPNRDRVLVTTVSGTGAGTSFAFGGYAALKTSLAAWGDANGYGFTASMAAGVDSKIASGFALEGAVFAPDSTTLYLGLRAPLVPVTSRNKALLVPVKNFETWFNNGTQTGNPTYGSPIELDLGGRGIRDMTRMSNGTYIIVAGNVGGTPLTGAIYKWTGNVNDTPKLVTNSVITNLNAEGVMEINSGGTPSLTSLQIISDHGDDIFYNDGTEAKDFGDLIYRKFTSDIITGLDLSMPTISVNTVSNTNAPVSIYPNPATNMVTVQFTATATEQNTISITDMNGRTVYTKTTAAAVGINQVVINTNGLAQGVYMLQLVTPSTHSTQKLVISSNK